MDSNRYSYTKNMELDHSLTKLFGFRKTLKKIKILKLTYVVFPVGLTEKYGLTADMSKLEQTKVEKVTFLIALN